MTGRSMRLAELNLPDGAVLLGDGGVGISGISYDSRSVQPHDLFVCLVGGYADGHAFANRAIAAGAVALLVERALAIDVPQIVVADTRVALPAIASSFYGHPADDLVCIGITGTDGKTTTSFILDHVMRSAGHTTGVIGTVSVRIADEVVDHETRQTTPESSDMQRLLRQMVDVGVSHAIVEATSHGLSRHRLDGVRFQVAAVTNITTEHLELHGSVEAYWAAKGILFDRVARLGGTAVINLDDEGSRSMLDLSDGSNVIIYSVLDPSATIWASDVKSFPTSTRFVVHRGGERWDVELPLIGHFNVSNALCAIGIALHCGVEPSSAVVALKDTPQILGRMQVVDSWRPVKTIVDYAHTPASLEIMLRTMRASNPSGRLIAVFGSAGERDVPKRALQGAVAARLADIAVFTNEDPREEDELTILEGIAAGARSEGWVEGHQFWLIPDRRLAIRYAVAMAEPGDVLLLAGKGHERSIIVGQRKTPWNEAEVAAEELARRFRGTP